VITNSTSPYIYITQEVIKQYQFSPFSFHISVEKDWSSAAFWYEYVALHGGEITLPGLSRDSLQGDKVVADIFVHLGIHTEYTEESITITKNEDEEFLIQQPKQLYPTTLRGNQHPAAPREKANDILSYDFSACPDLYPAVALTCERLGIELHATGVESLPLKESDRLRAVREHRTDADHRMAMALLVAGYEVDDTDCISKSYPQFLEHFHRINTLKLQ
jgi:3-phosphoshikimate 1-carboxyvinyltransferase